MPAGYKYDECSAEALIARMSVKDGRLVLPDGMSYRLLVLPAKRDVDDAGAGQKNQTTRRSRRHGVRAAPHRFTQPLGFSKVRCRKLPGWRPKFGAIATAKR